ncbi:Asp23/Gls24 family envelope stress response protein, partial [Pseudonocardia sp. KRD291]|uniref:Asp23/Gls24 family envelope stress response protein n=1 Tax=Pseudonocardia sp. KRD291 TaxID=2792007 RepID=UPI001C4A46BB
TKIAEAVVSKIAGLAAREVNGVYALGGGAARTFGAIRERIPGASTNVAQGVSVEVGDKQAAIDLNIVVEYGVAIADLAKAVRRNVISALERMTGLQVVEVNISVDDVHLPSEDDGRTEPEQPTPSSTPRVS